MALTRRRFLERLTSTASAAMTYEAMAALGMLPVPAAAAPFELRGAANGASVVVLGGGLAGLATAYELTKLGYDCRILEARMRPGGRCHTVRRGTVGEETGSTQIAAFDEGLYYNPGPMRIPHHHQITLGYCRELGVAIEVFVNENEATYLYQTKSKTLGGKRLRRAVCRRRRAVGARLDRTRRARRSAGTADRTGAPNLGGPIVTAGGLVFIGATNDRRFRAFDSRPARSFGSKTCLVRQWQSRSHTRRATATSTWPLQRADRVCYQAFSPGGTLP